MPIFTAPDGVRLHYEVQGEGPALVLHLGAGCDAGLWRAARLPGREHINSFLASDLVLPTVREFLLHQPRPAAPDDARLQARHAPYAESSAPTGFRSAGSGPGNP